MKELKCINNVYQSRQRSQELSEQAGSYMEFLKAWPDTATIMEQTAKRRQQILQVLGGSEEEWSDWKWQFKHRINNARVLSEIIGLNDLEINAIERVGKRYRWSISPYYLSLVGEDYKDSPIYRQAVPDIRELEAGGIPDPMNETLTSPAPCVTRRYPDRMIINVTNQCAMYCRHCQRRRNIGERDQHADMKSIERALRYVAENEEIRDVLITGGDALLLNPHVLQIILAELHRIPHVEIKRIGTRLPVTLPQRITPELCDVLRRYPPIYINTQFNHPLEITLEAGEACDRLTEAGVVLGNQAVLLRGINDQPFVMRKLNQELLKIRVRPYYIFHAKDVQGTRHFQTSIEEGMEIIESLRGHTSGMAVPNYIINAPGGWGKIPLNPDHVLQIDNNKAVLRTWEGRIIEVHNPPRC
ncbi:MAG TPA: KamA family radical SAM protein [Syntrophomonas sp.]|nr:KamA family radical SAM protein [Syntrophomonas sp.]